MKGNKKITVPIIIISIIIVVLALCQLLEIWKDAIYVFEPLMGIVLILQIILFWNTNRKVALIQLAVAVFILCVAAYILLI